MLSISWFAVSFAADAWVDVPFEPPAEVSLFLRAEIAEVRGKVDTDDCPGAVRAALDEAAKRGRVVRVVVSPTDLQIAAQASCKQRKAGDAVSASVVDLVAVVVVPGEPESVYPRISAERSVQIAALLGSVAGGGLGAAQIDDLAGRAWVRLGNEVVDEVWNSTQLDVNARASKAYERFVPAWTTRWAPVIATIPEVHGAVLEVAVTSEDPDKGKKTRLQELYRFAVPSALGASFVRGELNDDEFLAGVAVERAESARKRDFAPLQLDVIQGGLAVEGDHGRVERDGLDVREEDLEGVEDEDAD